MQDSSRKARPREVMTAERGQAEGYERPKKKNYRARAHSNPLNDQVIDVPAAPASFDWWSTHFPSLLSQPSAQNTKVEFADIGCGFGGLLVQLSPVYPDQLIVGLELRDKVAHYVSERIKALRQNSPGNFNNISVVRANAQKSLVNYFAKGQLKKLFFLFPDPHFKATNHRRRIIQTSLLAEYAYCLAPEGLLYTMTDVPELEEWMKAKLLDHPLFEAVSEDSISQDPAACVLTTTEEGQKVARNNGQIFKGVYRRIASS